MSVDLMPFFISFKLAFFTTVLLFCLCLPLAWLLSQSHSKIKPFFEAAIALPLVLPPSVLGFYLLICFSNITFFNTSLAFSFTGLVLASCIYSLPFMFQPLQSGFESLDKNILEASYICGKSPLATLFKVALPNIKPSLLTAFTVTFAHTVGEFGIVLMIGGSVPEKTKVASVAIYEFVEILEYENAHIYSFIMLIFSFLVLFSVYMINQKMRKRVQFL